MKLRQWIDRPENSMNRLAREADVPRRSLRSIVDRERPPKLAAAFRICAATEWEVGLADLLPPDDVRKLRRRFREHAGV